MKKLALASAILAFAFSLNASLARTQESKAAPPAGGQSPSSIAAPQSAQPAAQPPEQPRITAYTLPPDLYKKTRNLDAIFFSLTIFRPLFDLFVLWMLLRWRLGVTYRNWAEHSSRRFVLQGLLIAPLSVLTMDAINLPLRIFGLWVLRKYGLVVESWPSLGLDRLRGEAVNILTATVAVLILYALIRKSPRRWWFYFWLASLPLAFALVFIQPLVIDPLFNRFEPLAERDPALTVALERMVHRAGQDIPPERMYWMDASAKETGLNAYVTGVGASKRIIVWDTTIAKMTTPQIVAVAGHEMGHYVLNHITKGLLISGAGLLVGLFIGFHLIGWLLARKGAAWQIRGVDDWASLPALAFLFGVFTFVAMPITNGFSRYIEHQADQYALEVTHGLTPDSSQVAAQMFQILGETDLDYPDPGPIDVFLTYDHPATRDRVRFALTYDPWSKGGTGEFVH